MPKVLPDCLCYVLQVNNAALLQPLCLLLISCLAFCPQHTLAAMRRSCMRAKLSTTSFAVMESASLPLENCKASRKGRGRGSTGEEGAR